MSSSTFEICQLEEAVLVVENDREIATYYVEEMEARGITAEKALTISDAWDKWRGFSEQEVKHAVILLDLMFDRHDVTEGREFLRKLSREPEFIEHKVNVIVLTGVGDAQTKQDILSDGAREFHVKGGDPKRVLDDVMLHLGRNVLVTTSLLEVVEIDESKHEMYVRYRASEENNIRCTLDVQFAPKEARVPGGSFWLEVFKHIRDGQISFQALGRAVDIEEDAQCLSELLGAPES